MLRILTIVGARPQFIKAAAVSRAIHRWNSSHGSKQRIEEILVHTGQHYDATMSQVFFDELEIPRPHHNLGVGSGLHGRQTGRMLEAIEGILLEEKPDIVLVYGDTNSTLAGVLSAAKLHILCAHVEAGLRSFNRKMPEEINRVMADGLSNLLFCPTAVAVDNLAREGIGRIIEKAKPCRTIDFDTQLVFLVGDVMYDSILFNTTLSERKSIILDRLEIEGNNSVQNGYYLVTIHRAENTDSEENLKGILKALQRIASRGKRIILPLHPRTREAIRRFNLHDKCLCMPDSSPPCHHGRPSAPHGRLTITEPLGYLDMLQLEKHADAIVTDSGGVQKEAYLLRVPCITLRNETEWVETVRSGWNKLTGPGEERIVHAYQMLQQWDSRLSPFGCHNGRPLEAGDSNIESPYGDGRASEKIVEIIWNTLCHPSDQQNA